MYYLGIDIGGSNIKFALVTAEGKKKGAVIIKTPHRKKRFLAVLGSAIQAFVDTGEALKGIGVGVPGIVDLRKGILINAPNAPFLNGWNIKNFFKKFKIPIKIDNDSRCFLRTEAQYGAGKGFKHIAALTVGTGVGGGLFLDGKIYFGGHFGAGEFGHMVIHHGKTLEQLAGKKAFKKQGDRSEIIGIGVANIINALDPGIIILGGGGVFDKKLKLSVIRAKAKKYVMSPFGKKTKIVKGAFGIYAGAIGATLLFKEKNI